jgi:hypothetical protein
MIKAVLSVLKDCLTAPEHSLSSVKRIKSSFKNHRTMSQKTIQIANGPSREELFDGLRLFAEKREVGFVIEHNGTQLTLPVIMQGIQSEDGSGQSWNIMFNIEVKTMLRLSLPVEVKTVFEKKKTWAVKAYYSTKTRKGAVIFE